MTLNKRDFIKYSGAAIGAFALSGKLSAAAEKTATNMAANNAMVNTGTALRDLTADVKAISKHERLARIANAQAIMKKLNIAATVLEPGAAMDYFSGIQWWRSERLTAVIIPREGDIGVVCPAFEEPSIRESLALGNDVRVWQEHQSPFAQIKQLLTDRGLAQGTIAFESSVRYFVLQGVMSAMPTMANISAEPVTRGCRMIKSRHEIQLMHKANEITLTAYAHVWPQITLGMTSADITKLMQTTQAKLGGQGIWNMALINEASAYPHGTNQVQTVRAGSVVLMDCGCNVHGYHSDISRTFVVGTANKRQQDIWQTVRTGQQIAFDTAKVGLAAGKVDDAVRAYYNQLGFGPGYLLPGLSHRTGHGIGMETHENFNFVHGETSTLATGMCFSNEPGIYIPGEFGVRLEDCIYLTANGPQWFTEPASSLEQPLGKIAQLSADFA